MKYLSTHRGLTLVELLIASILVGIVMAGALSVDYAVRSLQKNDAKHHTLTSRTSAAMLQMTRDAMKTVGDINDEGISSVTCGSECGICFRQDTDSDPNSYANDTWVCYGHGASNQLVRCSGLATAVPDCEGMPQNNVIQLSDSPFFEIVRDADNRIKYIELTIHTITNKDLAPHPLGNPTYSLTSRISPPGISR
jgi:prepilin-type N-terminal cleavage/methylation domain-containing protein